MGTGRSTGEFAEFAVSRHRALFRYAYLLVGERGLAEDLVQEALTRTYVGWHRLRDSANAEAYTRKAITSTAIGWYRRKAWNAERPRDDVPELPARATDGTWRRGCGSGKSFPTSRHGSERHWCCGTTRT
jgi:DNA-directed RNA polymerase specialized sigma24 family protein